jgi:isopentenyl diphosphate isomerase/L-lactate dehydrogenase-like FMN-dependent dehydrogenase
VDSPAECTTVDELVTLARANLTTHEWDKLMGGTESETTLRRNRLGFDSIAFRPRIQSEDAAVDASATFLGHRLRAPVMAAPIGSLHVVTPDGALASARAAFRFGSVAFVSSASRASFEEIAQRVSSPMVLQLAIRGDYDWCRDTIDRARAAGYVAVCLTLDTARLGRQERQIVNNRRPSPPEHPYRVGLTWADLDRIRASAGLPIVVKGIATAEDARLAVEHGVSAICVSNHGGHGLDHGRASIDVLPEIAQTVGNRCEVVLDGGAMGGADVVKAVARGARAVLVGKLQGIALAANGEAGLLRALEIVEAEIIACMEVLGVARVAEIDATHVVAASAPPTAA